MRTCCTYEVLGECTVRGWYAFFHINIYRPMFTLLNLNIQLPKNIISPNCTPEWFESTFFKSRKRKDKHCASVIGFLSRKKDADCCTITDDALSEKRGKNKFLRKKLNTKKGKEKKKKTPGISDLSLETRGPFHCA